MRTPPAYQPRSLRGALPGQPRGRPHLGASFALRCFQRLSLPYVANQQCRWRDNWHTRGTSAPVLSYWGQLPSSLLRPRRIGTELSHAHESRIATGADYTFTPFPGAGVLWDP